jgi:RNA polymerase sigma-70 factor (ECF subfamily)
MVEARPQPLAAFEQLYREQVGAVYGLCRRLTGEAATAEDAVQETFLRAWRALPQFQARAAVGTWLHRIAINVVLDGRRRKSTHMLTLIEGPGAEWQDTATFDSPVEEAELERALESLPDGARDVLVLSGIYGYSHEETSEMLQIAVGTCKAQLHRARRLLRERLKTGVAA